MLTNLNDELHYYNTGIFNQLSNLEISTKQCVEKILKIIIPVRDIFFLLHFLIYAIWNKLSCTELF
jgi:hypothetical protein